MVLQFSGRCPSGQRRQRPVFFKLHGVLFIQSQGSDKTGDPSLKVDTQTWVCTGGPCSGYTALRVVHRYLHRLPKPLAAEQPRQQGTAVQVPVPGKLPATLGAKA